MRYSLKFHADAFIEWERLDPSARKPLAKKLWSRQDHPRLESQRLRGKLFDCYRIRHDKTGYRLIYLVEDDALIMRVLSVGRRDELQAYRVAETRLD